MDKRLGEKLIDYLRKESLLGHCYDSSRAGGAKGLLDKQKPDLAESFWNDIEIGVNKGGVKEIILCQHTDCAAYGGSRNFESLTLERQFQIAEMKKAKELILAKYPVLKVKMILAEINLVNEVEFKNVED